MEIPWLLFAAVALAELLGAVLLLNGFFVLRMKKQREARRLQNERAYYNMMEDCAQPSFLLLRRADLYPAFQSKNFETFTGLRAESLCEDIEHLAQAFERNAMREFLQEYKAWDGTGVLSATAKMCGREECWAEATVVRSADKAYDLLMLRDVSAEKSREAAMTAKLEAAENESKSKTTFLSRMSHEIRTPMNGIIGMITLAEKSINTPGQALDYLDQAGHLSQFLLSLINDILDMSRIEAGKIVLESERFDLFALAEKLRSMFQKNIEGKGVRFAVELLDFDVRYVIGDELRITQVLTNFLSNAMKFTSSGEIRVTFRQMMRTGNGVDLMLRVRDTGIGMNADFLNRIFQPFVQESTGVTKTYGGSGLGMAIADQLVELMGGNITVESLQGKGSEFTVFLTLPVAEEGLEGELTAQPAQAADTIEGVRILMAEDNHVNALIAVKLLTSMGASVEVAVNGEEAVDRFTNAPAGTFDVILMDIKMPVMDGWQATKAIRALARPDAGKIPIFALSADAFVEDKRHSVEVGMNGHLSKPIDFEELKHTVAQALQR